MLRWSKLQSTTICSPLSNWQTGRIKYIEKESVNSQGHSTLVLNSLLTSKRQNLEIWEQLHQYRTDFDHTLVGCTMFNCKFRKVKSTNHVRNAGLIALNCCFIAQCDALQTRTEQLYISFAAAHKWNLVGTSIRRTVHNKSTQVRAQRKREPRQR